MMRRRKKVHVATVLNYLLFVIIGIIMLYPFWYVVMYSFSDPSKSSLNSLYLWPAGFTVGSYIYAFSKKILFSGFFNSVFLTVVGTCVNMLLTIMLAYPLSREKLPGRKYLSAFVIFPMLFNGGMIPTYLVIKQFGLLNSLWSLITSMAVNVYNLLILSKFFKSIPDSLIEAAKIDGCGDATTLVKIVLPLSKASLATISLFYAVQHWNEFLHATIYINTDSKWPLQVVLRNIIDMVANDLNSGGEVFMNPENFKMATIVITVLPIICVYPFLQKHFTQGVMMGSVKG
ncbi:ABC transporter permease subunit [Clostridium sp. MCC353]|uniref:carbohydrate ABC transporter permease n=1 Tax=Clostridium sp. MCC353 TaxID=2592646 RepID=UPI001C018079|nr:carbohydrate ABC transporter permease [Clostridium sp. MCC353]MBT9779428.1 ABC transporter permease subunit [Clostridium sp. MCC353]